MTASETSVDRSAFPFSLAASRSTVPHDRAIVTAPFVAHLLLLFLVMKNLALFLVFAVAVAYYFGYEPSDLIPSGPTPAPKVRRTPAAPEQTPGTPPQRSSGSLVAASET